MQRRINNRPLGQLWVERIVWRVLAATSLAVMIGILLCSLRWLDELDSVQVSETPRAPERARIEFEHPIEKGSLHAARVDAPGG